ncbi:MAG: SpoIIE family protein phosphatase [Lachnospiraceae bacterium]|nr:SpoIIE family protein phosphatase [Lachnospiraceae bacterium]
METGELSIGKSNRGSVLNSSNIDLVEFVNNALKGGKGCEKLAVNGKQMYLAYAPLKTLGWTLLLGISEEALEKPATELVSQVDEISEKVVAANGRMAKQAQLIIILIAIVLVFMSMIVSFRHSERLVSPILQLKDAGMQFIEREGIGLDHAPNFFGKLDLYTGDEIEDLWVTMQDLEINIVTSVRSLQRVTAEKERIDTELSVATRIQSDMLPKLFPAFPDKQEFDIYSTMDPAKEVGGDFYDFFLIDDDHLAVVIADVSGKGVPAALFMVIARTIIKNVTLSGLFDGPGEILYDVNNRLCEGNDEDMFVTVWLGILTISTGHLVSASAGHEYPAFCQDGAEFALVKDIHGPGLGTFENVDFEEWEWNLKKGDLLFLYTDGIPEATNAEEEIFGIDRMLEVLNKNKTEESLEKILKKMREGVNDFVGDAPQFDDLTMTILRYRG